MSTQPRQIKRDIIAIALCALTTFTAVSLVTFDAGDPIDTPIWPIGSVYQPAVIVHPTNDTIQNACGHWGALTARALLDATGIGAIIIVIAMAFLAVSLLIYGEVKALAIRSLGVTIILVALVTAAALAPWYPRGMPVFGAGGCLGAMTSTWLGQHFAFLGSWILTLAVFACGLLLSTDYLLFSVGKAAIASGCALSATGLRKTCEKIPTARRLPYAVGEGMRDLDELAASTGQATNAADEDEPAIKIRGRQLDDLSAATPDKPGLSAKRRKTGPADSGVAADQTAPETADLDQPHRPASEGDARAAKNGRRTAKQSGQLANVIDQTTAEEVASRTRELEVDDATVSLRLDESHEDRPEPRIKAGQRRKESDKQGGMFANLSDSFDDDADDYRLPSLELLTESDDICYEDQLREVKRKAQILEATFKSFGFDVRVVEIETGPVIAQYEIELEAGLRLSKITGLADDVAIALRVPSVRIVAPIPGKNTVGVEVPNENRQVVRLREVIEEAGHSIKKMNIPVFLGKDVSGNPMTVDLAKMPHLLIAGRTGTGKSVCLNAIITSILMTCRPSEVRMLMIDPKMVELSGYGRLPHLMHPVITDMRKAEAILAWAVDKMEERYSLLARVGVRHINSYNTLGRDEIAKRLEIEDVDESTEIPDHLPFIVIVADEMADLMMTAGKDVEQHIIRLAQKSRAVGIHLILATQKPTVDVITGLIKSNLPARLSFQVASKTDSRVVLDENGADKLLGNGDMLFLWPGTSTLIRGQGTFLSDEEIERVCHHCASGSEQSFVGELLSLKVEDEGGADNLTADSIRSRDDLYESAVDLVIREGRGSCSLLQRALGIGYGRAARLIDFMAEDGIVGHYNGSKAREVIMTLPQWEAMQGVEPGDADSELDEAKPNRGQALSQQGGQDGEDAEDDWEEVD